MQNSEHRESTFYPIQAAAQAATSEEKFPPAARHPLPTWEVNWQSIQSNINLQLLQGLLEAEHTSLTQAKGKDLILFLGLSGAGKSTTLNYLKGCEMEPHLDDSDHGVGEIYLKPAAGNQVYAKMGATVESETLSPNIIPFSNFQCFADCPGFEDNRGNEYQLCAKVTTQSVIKWSNSVKAAVIVINHADVSGRAANFQRLVRELRQVFNDLNAVASSVIFLINRARENVNPQHVINKIKQLQAATEKKLKNYQPGENPGEKQKEELAEDLAQLMFFNFMLAHSDNIMMVNPLDGGASRELIMRRLATFVTPIHPQQFNLPRHDNDHLEFNKLLVLLFEKGTGLLTDVKELRKKIADDTSEYQRLKTQTLPEAQARLSDAQTNKNKSIFQLQLEDNQAKQKEESSQIERLESEIELVKQSRIGLVDENTSLNTEELVGYWEKSIEMPDDRIHFLLMAGYGAAMMSGGGGGIALMGIGAAALVGESVVFSTVERLMSPVKIHYKDVPYSQVECWLNGRGWFKLKKDEPETGIYSAKFYGNPFYLSKAEVKIKLPKKNVPANMRRIEEIKIEIESLKRKELELNAAKMAHTSMLENLDVKAESIKQSIENEKLRLIKGLDEPAASSPEEWEALIAELQSSVSTLNHKIAELEIHLVDLPTQLRVAEQEMKQRWSFINFLSGVAEFTSLPQGIVFNVLFREIRLLNLDPQFSQAFINEAALSPYEAKEDDGQPLAAPNYASLFNQGPPNNLTNPAVPPGSRIPLRVPQPLFSLDPS